MSNLKTNKTLLRFSEGDIIYNKEYGELCEILGTDTWGSALVYRTGRNLDGTGQDLKEVTFAHEYFIRYTKLVRILWEE